MTVDTISENISLSKWFLTSKAPYSNPCLRLPSFLDKNTDIVLSALRFLEPDSRTFCTIKSEHKSIVKNSQKDTIFNAFNQQKHHLPLFEDSINPYMHTR